MTREKREINVRPGGSVRLVESNDVADIVTDRDERKKRRVCKRKTDGEAERETNYFLRYRLLKLDSKSNSPC